MKKKRLQPERKTVFHRELDRSCLQKEVFFYTALDNNIGRETRKTNSLTPKENNNFNIRDLKEKTNINSDTKNKYVGQGLAWGQSFVI